MLIYAIRILQQKKVCYVYSHHPIFVGEKNVHGVRLFKERFITQIKQNENESKTVYIVNKHTCIWYSINMIRGESVKSRAALPRLSITYYRKIRHPAVSVFGLCGGSSWSELIEGSLNLRRSLTARIVNPCGRLWGLFQSPWTIELHLHT